MTSSLPARAAAFAGCAIAGLLLGGIGAFFQALRFTVPAPWGSIPVPWGAVLMIALLLLAIRWAALGLASQAAGWLIFAGWLGATVLFALESPSGDLAISSGARQWGYLLAGVVLGAAGAVLPLPKGGAR